MLHVFGILGPGRQRRAASAESPHKANFFGGLPDAAAGAVPMSRAEQDALYLGGKAPAAEHPVERDESAK
jgi:hypothetical protein